MSAKSPNPIDRHVGSRVRTQRMVVGMSQERLGEALGITFQQIQKYEKGINRISASRLQQIAGILGVGLPFFYEGAPQADAAAPGGFAEGSSPPYVTDLMATPEGLRLVRAFTRIDDPKVRRRIVDLVVTLAGEAGEGETRSS